MTILITAILLLAFAVFIMSFNIIFRNKPFPDGEIGRNKELRKRGIICAKEEEQLSAHLDRRLGLAAGAMLGLLML